MNENFENNEIFQKLPEDLKEFFHQLPDETKEKILNCKSEEEAMDVLKGDMIPLPDDALDAVADGDDYSCWGDCAEYNRGCMGY